MSANMDSKEAEQTHDPAAQELRADSHNTAVSPDPPSSENAVSEKQEVDDSQPPPQPNGGLMAWLQVAAAWSIFFNVLGLLNTYGQFQTLYETSILSTESASSIAWIGSAQFFVTYVVCIFTGPLLDTGNLHPLLISGTIIAVFGMMMTSLCKVYYQFFLAQTIVTGVGFGLIFLPASSIVGQWFSTRQPVAIGVSVSASGIGAIIYPIMLQRLTESIGFGWTVRIMAFMILGTMIFAMAVMRPRVAKNPRKRKVIDLKHFKDKVYSVAVLSFFLTTMGIYVIYYYITLYASEVAGTPPYIANYMLPILNAGSTLGRLSISYIGQRYGLMNVQIIFGIITGALTFALLGIKTPGGVIAFSVVYGFVSAPYVSFPIPIVTSVTADKSVWATRLGMSFAIIGLGGLLGSPIAGAILGGDSTGAGRNWAGMCTWCGVLFFVGTAVLAVCRVMKAGWKLNVVC